MTTTTQTPMTSAAIQSLDPSAVSALTSLKAACKACEDADNAQGKKGAEKADDKYDGACQDDAKKRFLAQGKAIVDDMWAKFNALQDGYQSSLRPHENVGPRLHQAYTDTWVVVGQKIAPVIADVQKRQQQDHWTGAGADDYMSQLPVQFAALNEFSQYVSVTGAGVETPAQLLRVGREHAVAVRRLVHEQPDDGQRDVAVAARRPHLADDVDGGDEGGGADRGCLAEGDEADGHVEAPHGNGPEVHDAVRCGKRGHRRADHRPGRGCRRERRRRGAGHRRIRVVSRDPRTMPGPCVVDGPGYDRCQGVSRGRDSERAQDPDRR